MTSETPGGLSCCPAPFWTRRLIIKKIPFLALGFGAFSWLLFQQGWTEALEFNRLALGHGQLWRLFTAHFTHFSAEHMKWDVAVFVALGALVELRSRRHFVRCLLGSALLISLGVFLLQPQFLSYRGLSGVDNALFGYVAVDVLKLALEEKRWTAAFVSCAGLVLFGLKVGFELFTGRTVFVDNTASFTPVPLAHLLGLAVGAVCVLDRSAVMLWRRLRTSHAAISIGTCQPENPRPRFP